MATKKSADVIQALQGDRTLRAQVIKMLARDYPKDYLKHVKVDAEKINRVSPKVLVSDKEWQE